MTKYKVKTYNFLDKSQLVKLSHKFNFFIRDKLTSYCEIDINPCHKWFRKGYFTIGYDIRPFSYDLTHKDKVKLIEALYKELKTRYGLQRLSKRYGVLELTYNQFNNMYNLMRLRGDI